MSITSAKTGATGISLALENNYMEPIASVLVGAGGVPTVIFNDIPQTYKHLQLRCLARSATAAQTDGLRIRFNGDSGTNYARHVLYGEGSVASASAAASGNLLGVTDITAASATASAFGVAVLDILDYTNTNKNKTTRTLGGGDTNSASFGQIDLFTGLWINTNAITSMTLFTNSNANIVQYSRFSLYGIKG